MGPPKSLFLANSLPARFENIPTGRRSEKQVNNQKTQIQTQYSTGSPPCSNHLIVGAAKLQHCDKCAQSTLHQYAANPQLALASATFSAASGWQ